RTTRFQTWFDSVRSDRCTLRKVVSGLVYSHRTEQLCVSPHLKEKEGGSRRLHPLGVPGVIGCIICNARDPLVKQLPATDTGTRGARSTRGCSLRLPPSFSFKCG